jgi:hypothetical protein
MAKGSRMALMWLLWSVATATAQVAGQSNAGVQSNPAFRSYREQATVLADHVPWAFPQKDWSIAYQEVSSYQRTLLSERIGNQGSALYAKTEGLETILGARQKMLRQGPDRVCRDPRTGQIILLENKGGKSQPKTSFGYEQGTVENKVKSLENALRSPNLGIAEREAYAIALEAAAKGTLQVRLIRTQHDAGSPQRPQLETISDSTPRSRRLAYAAINNLSRSRPDLPEIGRLARMRATEASIGGSANAGIGILLMLDTAAPAYDDLVASLDPASRSRASVLRLGQNGSLFVSGASLTMAGSSSLATLWTTNEALAGRLASFSEWSGRAGVIFALAAEGFVIWQYEDGRISGRQAATFTACFAGGAGGAWVGAVSGASAGATVGGFVGVWFFGAGAAPGAAIGGAIGGILGGIGGGWGGSALAGWATDSYFQFKDDGWGRQQRVELLRFLSAHYAAN